MAQWKKNLSAMQETQVRSLGPDDLLEEEMAIHFSILVWKIPWTEEPGRGQELDMTEHTHILSNKTTYRKTPGVVGA